MHAESEEIDDAGILIGFGGTILQQQRVDKEMVRALSDSCNKRSRDRDIRMTKSMCDFEQLTPSSTESKRAKNMKEHESDCESSPRHEAELSANMAAVVIATPPPQSFLFDWCTCERDPEKIRRAFWMMEIQEPTDLNYVMQLNIPTTVHYVGCRNIFDTISTKILKPRNQIEAFIERMRTMQHPLNFTVVGPNGSGRRRAIRFACSEANVCTVTISKERYEPMFITMATQYAYFRRPFLLLFDGFDELIANPDFLKEFNVAILANPLFTMGWNNVWIVLTVTMLDSAVTNMLSHICYYDNIVFMEKPKARNLYDFLIKYIEEHNISVPEPTDAQSNRLLTAIQNATPADAARFGNRVIANVMDNTPIEDLAKCTGRELPFLTQQKQIQDKKQVKKNLPIPREMPTRSTVVSQSSVLAVTNNEPVMLNMHNNTMCPRVNWQRDIESKYLRNNLDVPIIPYNTNEKYIERNELSIIPW